MNEQPKPPEKAIYIYTLETLQKLAADMMNDPELGCHSRVVSAFSGYVREYSGPQPDTAAGDVLPDAAGGTSPNPPGLDFNYIIMSI